MEMCMQKMLRNKTYIWNEMAFYISPQEMLAAFENNKSQGKRLLITAAVSAGKGTIDAGYEMAEIGKYVEWSSTVGFLELKLILSCTINYIFIMQIDYKTAAK